MISKRPQYPNPIISTMKHFREEYIAYIKDVDHPQGEGKYVAKNKDDVLH